MRYFIGQRVHLTPEFAAEQGVPVSGVILDIDRVRGWCYVVADDDEDGVWANAHEIETEGQPQLEPETL